MNAPEPIVRPRIALEEVALPTWRLIESPTSAALLMLHDTVVASFLWGGWHLWAFQVADGACGIPDPEHRLGGSRIYRPESLRLRDTIAKGIKLFDYLYDFDAEWRHRIDIEAVTEGSAPGGYPRVVEGEGRCPPENVGGPQGYAAFLEAVANPERSGHADILNWYDGDFDPHDIEDWIVRIQISRIANKRRAGVIAYHKSKAKR
jgi:hypothetical protein